MENEIWKPIKGFENYMISSNGDVLSLNGKPKLLRKGFSNGYMLVILSKNNIKTNKYVHRLVAEAFIYNDDQEHKTQVNHINECKDDNRVCNLEWVTPKQNVNHGTYLSRRSQTNTNGKKSKPVIQYSLDGDFIKEWPSIREIERQLGYNNAFICRCCTDKPHNNTAYGYIWKYKDAV